MRLISTCLLSLVLASFSIATIASAQCPAQMALGAIAVASTQGNPFQAESIASWPEAPTFFNSPLKPSTTLVARDSAGRVRFERSTGKYRFRSGSEQGTEAEQKMISICDPATHEMILIDSLNKTARIFSSGPRLGLPQIAAANPDAASFCHLPAAYRRSSLFQVEDLGHKGIEGMDAQGWRITTLGQPGGTNTVQPATPSARELWCSEELGAVILAISSSTKPGAHHQVVLTKIQHGEPDASLFQIPSDYTVTERAPDFRSSPLLRLIPGQTPAVPAGSASPPQK